MHKILACTTAVLFSMQPLTAYAQNDDILVTARRAPQNAADYAGSAARLSAAQLADLPGTHPAQALNSIAGVNIHRGSGQEHLTAIRSPVLTGGAGAGSFLYLQDGVPLRAAGFANVNGLFESAIELAGAAEVSKGPGSVLYGSNAVHGLINVLSEAPSSEASAFLDTAVNTGGYVRLKASLSSPAPSGALRLSAMAAQDNGFRADSGYEQQKLQARYDGQAAGWDISMLAGFTNINQETAGFIQGPDAYKDDDIAASNPNPEAYRNGKSARIQARLSRPLGHGELTLLPYAREVKLDFLRHFVPGQAREENDHKSLGMLSSYRGAAGAADYIFGLDAEFTRGNLQEFQDGPSAFSFVTGPHYDYSVQSTVLSGYGQADIALSQKLTLDIGARADWTRYAYETALAPGLYGRFFVTPDRQDTFTLFTPKAALNYKISDAHTAYLRLARGARAPQTSDAYSLQRNQLAGQIKAEKLDAFEAGFKGRLGAVNYALDAYAMRKENFFFRDSSGFNVIDGKTKHKGVELSANGEILPGFKLGGFVSWAAHTYDFDRPNANASNAITKGDDVDTAPRFMARAFADYNWAEKFSLGLSWDHMGSYFTDPGNTQSYDGHDVIGLRGSLRISGAAEIYGRVENLLDADYADRADFAFGNERYFPGRPRTGFIGVRARF